ncbi:class I adenylate-forming enzyme family protein [Wukongibacter sp. M2B1]|uniref:class I adenylate-forming enzyme family protein n=1 Tax=Wukongibacter sp. M2B1 TaxID=3088895 RepID=UPI003D7AB5D1
MDNEYKYFESINLFEEIAKNIKPEQKIITLSKNIDVKRDIIESIIPAKALIDWAEEISKIMKQKGLTFGDKVLLIPASTPISIAIFLALLKLGCITVFVPMRLLPNEIVRISKYTKACYCFCSNEYSYLEDLTNQMSQTCPVSTLSISDLSEIDFKQKKHINTYDSRLNNYNVASILFTSGTTNRPKGIVLPSRAYITNALQIGKHIKLTSQDTFLQVLPLYYIAGQITAMVNSLLHGANLVLCRKFNPEIILRAVQEVNITVTNLVPTMISRLINFMKEKEPHIKNSLKYKSNNLRLCLTGGAYCSEEKKQAFRDLLGTIVIEGYGSTEYGCGICLNPIEKPRPKSVGVPLYGHDLRIVDTEEHNIVFSTNRIGELEVRNSTSMLGYYSYSGKMDLKRDKRWRSTGDLAYIDEEGYVYICGRTTDVIKRGGEKIFAGEIEEVLQKYPEVKDVAVIGVPDDDLGERPIAFLTGIDNNSQIKGIKEWVKSQLPYYRQPELKFINAMPLTPSGKISKNILKKL